MVMNYNCIIILFFVYVLIDGVENMFGIEGSATGYNDYYTVYTMYK